MTTILKWTVRLIVAFFGCAIVYISPFWLKKYPFSKEDKYWLTMYELGDSLLFSNGADTDTIIINRKRINEPNNRFGFDWERYSIWHLLEVSCEFPAVVYYNFYIMHDTLQTEGAIHVEKTRKGIDIWSSIGGIWLEFKDINPKKEDKLYGDLSKFSLSGNKYDHIPNIWSCSITPKDGLIEYSFKDGRVYKLIKRIPVKDSKYYQEHKAE